MLHETLGHHNVLYETTPFSNKCGIPLISAWAAITKYQTAWLIQQTYLTVLETGKSHNLGAGSFILGEGPISGLLTTGFVCFDFCFPNAYMTEREGRGVSVSVLPLLIRALSS